MVAVGMNQASEEPQMADHTYPETDRSDDPSVEPDREVITSTLHWGALVRIGLVIVLLLLVVVLHLTGLLGPGLH